MNPRFAFLAALAWQTALLVNIGAPAAPEHLRLQRAIAVPSGAAGPVCAVLNAAVLAHTASAAHNDLRVYRTDPRSAAQAELPYVLTESGPEPVDAAQATVEHMTRVGDELHFDLRMPPRAYSELQLRVNAQDFIGTVIVAAADAHDGPRLVKLKSLGNFSIFDLHSLGLGRWTTLPMAEGTAPVLHLTLALRTLAGQPLRDLPPTLVEGAAVPPSRERQTVYTPVAATTSFTQEGQATVATLHVPAHVPVEQLRLDLLPGAHPNFAREVLLTARSDDDPFNDPETLDAGLTESVRLPSGDSRLNPIDVEENSLHDTLGATLASRATVEVGIQNAGKPPLPLAAATLEMRERRVCFTAVPDSVSGSGSVLGPVYMLRYGDPALPAPLYADPPQMTAPIVMAGLGPEVRNPRWTARRDTRPFFDRHPEVFWLLLLACAGSMGGTALQLVQTKVASGHGDRHV